VPDRSEDFAAVYDACVSQVYGFLVYRLGRREEAEDLTQQTFERALRAWGRYDPARASASTWLLTIAHNLLIDHYRLGRRGREQPLDDLAEQDHPRAPTPDPALGLDAALVSALSGLPTRSRELIALRYGADLSGPEIAAVTGLSLANVQQILSRSLRQMREELEPSNQSDAKGSEAKQQRAEARAARDQDA
jgi:RNA polymerase sigma-70 factor (ECF subfamily)